MTAVVKKDDAAGLTDVPQHAHAEPAVARFGSGDHLSARSETAAPLHAAPAPAKKRNVVARSFRFFMQLLLPLLALAAAFAGAQYLRATKPVAPPRKVVETRIPVTTAVAALQEVRPTISAFGTTVAGRQVEMRSLVAGRVIETGTKLRDGAIVPKGGLLLTIDPFDYRAKIEETKAQIAEAEAKVTELEAALALEVTNLAFAKEQLRLGEADLKRASELSRRGTLADRSVDERRLVVSQRRQVVQRTQNNLDVQRARIRQQKALIARWKTSLARDERRLAETKLLAPFEAYVTDVGAQVGRMLNANDRVATLIDRNWIDVTFTLSDRQYGRLLQDGGGVVGRSVTVVWDIGAKPVSYTATIDRISARVSSNTGGVEVFARIKNPASGVPIRAGAFVKIEIADILYTKVIKLPSTAVYDGSKVYVAKDGRLSERKVDVIGVDGTKLLVRGDIKAGERIVVTRLSAPGPGVAVQDVK